MARMFLRHKPFTALLRLAVLVGCILLLAACSGVEQNAAMATPSARSGRLTPYVTPSPSRTSAPTSAITATPTALPPSPTAVTHEVKRGEDLSGLALRYGIDLAQLIAANPTVNPRAMSVGTILIIPTSTTPMPTALTAQPNQPVTPTPIALGLGPLRCTRARDNGIWCFQGASNTQDYAIESLTGVITLRGGNGETASQKAALPLDTLQPGNTLALAAYFPPEAVAGLSDPILANSELHTALPYRDDGRYIPSQAENRKVFLSPDALSAEVTLDVTLTAEGQQHAQRVWVAAVAYDAEDNIVGVRRWENAQAGANEAAGETGLDSGEKLPVTMHIYSAGGAIERVEILTEARP